jgi:hypothetical protein
MGKPIECNDMRWHLVLRLPKITLPSVALN